MNSLGEVEDQKRTAEKGKTKLLKSHDLEKLCREWGKPCQVKWGALRNHGIRKSSARAAKSSRTRLDCAESYVCW